MVGVIAQNPHEVHGNPTPRPRQEFQVGLLGDNRICFQTKYFKRKYSTISMEGRS